jgi:DNA-binding transcriptional LysR family regulator
MMNTNYLRTFIEVINLKSFSKAASKLYVSQPAVTKQIQMLEKEIGVVLVKREGKEIHPTENGKDFYKHAINLLNLEDGILKRYQNKEDAKSLSDEITIYSSSLPANYILQDIISEFSKLYPKITYQIKKTDSKKVYDAIEAGNTGFGFTGTLFKKRHIIDLCIAEDELVLVAPPTEARQILENPEIEIKDMLDLTFILREKGSATLKTFINALNEQGLNENDLNAIAIVEDNETIKNFIKKGIGVSVLSTLSISEELKNGSLLALRITGLNTKRSLYFIHHDNRYFSYAEKLFIDFMIHRFEV